MQLANQIRQRRKEAGLSQEGLAERIYVSRQTISNWETGRTYPDVESLCLLSALFGVSVDELIKGEAEMLKETMEQDAKRMRRLAYAIIALAMSAVVVFICGFTVWEWGAAPTLVSGCALAAVGLAPSFELERLKKKHDIVTYAELSAFEGGAEIDRSTPGSIQRAGTRNALRPKRCSQGPFSGLSWVSRS